MKHIILFTKQIKNCDLTFFNLSIIVYFKNKT